MDKSLLNQVQSDEREKDDIALAKNGMNLKKAKLKVLQRFASLASIMKNTKVVDTGSSTPGGIAATDGAQIKFNASRTSGFSEDTQAGILAHELKHIERGDTNKTWSRELNIATDAVINEEVTKSGLRLEGCVDIPNAIDMGADKIHDILIRIKSFLMKDKQKTDNAHADIDQAEHLEHKHKDEQFTEEDMQKAIFGNHSMWHKALDYLAHKEQQVTNKLCAIPKKLKGLFGQDKEELPGGLVPAY